MQLMLLLMRPETISIGESGEAEVEDLPVGLYYLIETTPPAGYDPLTTVICFDLSAESISTKTKEHVKVNGLELTVYNDPGVSLPATGGPGTKLFTILGLAMMMGAGVMLFHRRGMI